MDVAFIWVTSIGPLVFRISTESSRSSAQSSTQIRQNMTLLIIWHELPQTCDTKKRKHHIHSAHPYFQKIGEYVIHNFKTNPSWNLDWWRGPIRTLVIYIATTYFPKMDEKMRKKVLDSANAGKENQWPFQVPELKIPAK